MAVSFMPKTVLSTGLTRSTPPGAHTHVRGNAAGTAQSLRDQDVTVAEVLNSAGYATGLFGKWGLGEVGMEGHPLEQGFDAPLTWTLTVSPLDRQRALAARPTGR